ncbi:MAG: histidine--tRNA ligase, partial [Proteobacteria bacterium]|nr:histidine--tRNA ligase [Pseudomonadota bacterium]
MVIRAIKGTRDIFGPEAKKWNIVERKIFEFAKKYNYEEMKIPTFESTQLYLRGIGDETDIVNKEMYTFTDKGGRSITLRPEGTAGIVRAYIENKMYADKTV